MCRRSIMPWLVLFAISLGQYEYSLDDLNSSSEYYAKEVGPSIFPNHITLHYFGHFN